MLKWYHTVIVNSYAILTQTTNANEIKALTRVESENLKRQIVRVDRDFIIKECSTVSTNKENFLICSNFSILY